MNQKIIDLLVEAIIHAAMIQSNCRKPDLVIKRAEILVGSCGKHGILHQALTLLKQQPKQYLPSELIKDNNFVCQSCHHVHEIGGYKVVKEQPKCKTCGDSKEVPQKPIGCQCAYCKNGLDGCQIKIPCPDCQQPTQQECDAAMVEGFEHTISKEDEEWMNAPMGTPKQQPTAGEFTKIARLRLPKFLPDSYEGMKSLCATLTDTVNEACSIIDTSEAENKRLKNQKEYIYKKEIENLKAKLETLEAENKELKEIILTAPGSDEEDFLSKHRIWWNLHYRELRSPGCNLPRPTFKQLQAKFDTSEAILKVICEAWMKVESEMADNNPCPDLALRASYRKEAIRLTNIAIAKAKQGGE